MMKVWLERFSKPNEIHMKLAWLDNWFSLPFPGRCLASAHLASLLPFTHHQQSARGNGYHQRGASRSPEKQRKLSQIISFFGHFSPPYSAVYICFHQQVKERFRLGLKWEILENENVWNECQVEGKSSKSLVDCPTERSQITQIKYDLLTWWDLYNFLTHSPARPPTFAHLPSPGSLLIHATRHEDFLKWKNQLFLAFYHPSSANKGRTSLQRNYLQDFKLLYWSFVVFDLPFFLLSVPSFILIAFSHFPLAELKDQYCCETFFSFLPLLGRKRRENYALRKENNLLTWKIHIKNSF